MGLTKLGPESKMSLPPRREPITFRKRKESSKSYVLIQVMDTSYQFKLEGVFCIYNFNGENVFGND
jgi:hypothetical protein